jgi:hypothetical protein
MADIKFDIEVTGIKELKDAAANFERLGKVSSKLSAQYKPLGAQTARLVQENNRYARKVKELNKAVEQGVITQKQSERAQQEALRTAKERILSDKRLIEQQKRKAKAEAQARKETERLKNLYAPAKVAADKYQKTLKEIEKAYVSGTIEADDFAEATERVKREFAQYTAGVAKGGNQFARYNMETYKANQATKRFASVGLQQAGYQIGDFAVQMQSGTNIAVAFGQQMSQLLGILGAGGALAGAGVAIATAIIAPLIEMKKRAKDVQDAFEGLEQALNQIEKVELEPVSEEFLEAARSIRREFETTLSIMKEIAALKLQEELDRPLEAFRSEYQSFLAKSDIAGRLGADRPDFNILGFEDESRFVQAYQLLSQIQGKTKEEIAASVEQTAFWLRGSGLVTKEVKELLARYADVVGVVDQIRDKTQEVVDLGELTLSDEEKRSNAIKVRAALESAFTKRRLEAEQRQKKIEADRIKVRAALTAAALKKTALLEEEQAKNTAKIVSDRIKVRAALEAAAYKNLAKQEEILRQKQEANERAAFERRIRNDEEVMSQSVTISDDLLKLIEKNAKEAARKVKNIFEAESFLFNVRFADELAVMSQPVSPAKDAGQGAREAKENLTTIQDTIDALREQVKQENILLGITGERLKEEEIFYQLLEDNKKADIKLSEEKIRAIARQIAAQKQANEVIQKGIDFARDMSDVFSDFIMNGFRDFKSFVSDIANMFKRLLAEMVARALATKIFIPITAGFTGTMMGTAAGAATGSMIGAGIGGGGFLAGIGGAAAGLYSGFAGVMSGGGLGSSFANLGGLLSGSVGGLGAVGAAIPAIAAVAAVIGLLTKKTKVLDAGLRATVQGFDVAIDTFQVTQSSRLFGLLKGKKKTTFTEADAEIADPIIGAITEMQQSIKDAAVSLGIGAKAFDDFSYDFQLSLQGLTEDEQLQKINEEIVKMSNAFVSLTGHFEDVNELLAVAQQRYDLETRLLTLQGDTAELLIRQREREIEATHELNQEILLQIHALEDAQTAFDIAVGGIANGMSQLLNAAQGTVDETAIGVDEAFALVQRSIAAKKASIVGTFNGLMDGIQGRVQAAEDALNVSRSILSSLEGASSGSRMTRAAGLSYLRSLRGASRISDEKKLDEALKAIANPSQDLYTSFVDYQRDFQDQANLIRDLENQASQQLTTDEKALIALQDEAAAAESRHLVEIAALEEQLNTAKEQVDALKGIDNSVKSVEEAILILGNSISAAEAARAELEKLKEQADVYEATNNSFSSQFGTGGSYKGFDLAKIEGTNELLSAADMLGIGTTGKTGAEIQQEISNISGMAVRLDNATRENQFALGGYHSGGFRLVGERGPEIEATGPSRVFSANQAKRMMQNPDLVEAVRAMKEEITELRTEQRQLGINNNKYTKRTYDLYRQWDTEGLPAERT